MGRHVRKKAGYVHFRRMGAESPKREKAEYRYNEKGDAIVHLPKDSQVQLRDMLKVDTGGYLRVFFMYVVGVERDKKETRAKVLLCKGSVSITRVGRFRYNFQSPDKERDGLLTVCIRHVVFKQLTKWIYNWDAQEFEGQAEFLMWKCDVRPLDGLIYSYFKANPIPKDGKSRADCVGGVTKEYRYKVDSVEDSEYEGLIKVTASADNRQLPERECALWQGENSVTVC